MAGPTSSECTFNLHMLMDRITDQVKERGLTYGNLELWLERYLGSLVQRTRFRVRSNPEALLAGEYLIQCALQELAVRLDLDGMGQPLLTYQQYREIKAASRVAEDDGVGGNDGHRGGRVQNRDAGIGAEGLERMLGRGKALQQGDWAMHRQSIKSCFVANGMWEGESGWREVWEDDILVWQHDSASMGTGQLLHGVSYKRASSRDSTNFLIYYEVGQMQAELRPYVGQAQLFLRLEHPQTGQQARVVISNFYKLKPVRDEPDLADIVLQSARGQFHPQQCGDAVLLQMIRSPVIKHVAQVCRPGQDAEEWWSFVPFTFRSMANKVAKRADGQ